MTTTFNKRHLDAARTAALAARSRRPPAASGMSASDGLEALRTAPTAIRALLEGHRAALDEAHQAAAQDPNLSEEGQAARHGELRRQAEQAAAARAAEIRRNVSDAATAVTSRAESALPGPASGVEAMMGRQIAWNRTREMLDGGVPLDEVIGETTDPETLHALRAELPAYLRIKNWDSEARAGIVRTIDDQLAHAAGGSTLAAHQAAREAEQHAARLGPLLDHLDQVAAGKASPVSAMVSVIRAEHDAGQLAGAAAEQGAPTE